MTTSKMTHANAGNEPRFAESAFSIVMRRMRQAAAWWRNRRAYLHLMSLDDHLLKDIGIGRSEIYGAVNLTAERAPGRNSRKQA